MVSCGTNLIVGILWHASIGPSPLPTTTHPHLPAPADTYPHPPLVDTYGLQAHGKLDTSLESQGDQFQPFTKQQKHGIPHMYVRFLWNVSSYLLLRKVCHRDHKSNRAHRPTSNETSSHGQFKRQELLKVAWLNLR